jgi:hypothetical protein
MSETERNYETETLLQALEILEYETTALEQVAEALQEAQELVPRPSPEDAAGMRAGELPVTRGAYLLARLQQFIVAVENAASDLRTDLECRFDPRGVDLVQATFNALEAALEAALQEAAKPGNPSPDHDGPEL